MATSLDRLVRLGDVLALLPEEQRRMVTATLEPEPITLQEAARRFGISYNRLHIWLHRGHLKRLGYQRHPFGRARVLVDAKEVQRLLQHPPQPGRPTEDGAQETS